MDKVSISLESFFGCSVVVTNPQKQIPGGDGLRVDLLVSVVSEQSISKSFKAGLRSLCVRVLEEIPGGAVSGRQQTGECFLVSCCNVLQFIPAGECQKLCVVGCHVRIQNPVGNQSQVFGTKCSLSLSMVLDGISLNLVDTNFRTDFSTFRKLGELTGGMFGNLLIWFSLGSLCSVPLEHPEFCWHTAWTDESAHLMVN